jgi:hypothetical protein
MGDGQDQGQLPSPGGAGLAPPGGGGRKQGRLEGETGRLAKG